MADTIYKLTPLTDKDEISASPYSVDELLAMAAAGYDPMALAAKRAGDSMKKLCAQLSKYEQINGVIPVPQSIQDDITKERINNIQKEIYNMAGFNFGGMSRFERQMREKQAKIEQKKKEEEEVKKEEWIWVEGYKGTNNDMTCRGYQFEMHEQFDMPEGVEITDCESGFHLCKDLRDVFSYYPIGAGHRFFRVRALVRKADYEEYGKRPKNYDPWSLSNLLGPRTRDKLVAKSIQFLYELTPDEIFATFDKLSDVHTWDAAKKTLAMKHDLDYVRSLDQINNLVALGYSKAFAEYIVEAKKYTKAYAAGTQTDLSMDMKVLYILNG